MNGLNVANFGHRFVAFEGLTSDGSSEGLRMKHPRSVIVGAGVFVSGFTAMNLFSKFGDLRSDVPGLWSYRSATIGDGLLLPVAAALLVECGDRLQAAPAERWKTATAGAIGALCGSLLIVSWLRDPSPTINWTSPAPHQFNSAGWWHAIFLIAASGLFAVLIFRVLYRANRSRKIGEGHVAVELLKTPGAAIVFACLEGFVALVARDSFESLGVTTSFSAVATAGVATLVSIPLLWWGFGSSLKEGRKSILIGTLIALTLPLLQPGQYRFPNIGAADAFIVGILILPIFTQLWCWEEELWPVAGIAYGLLLVAAASQSVHLAAVTRAELLASFILPLATVAAIAVSMKRLGKPRRSGPEARHLGLALGVPIMLYLFAGWIQRNRTTLVSSNVIELIFGGIFVINLLYIGKERYRFLVAQEQYGDAKIEPGWNQDRAFWTTWTMLLAVFTSFLAAFFLIIRNSGSRIGIDSPNAGVSPSHGIMIGGTLAALALALIAVRKSGEPTESPPSLTDTIQGGSATPTRNRLSVFFRLIFIGLPDGSARTHLSWQNLPRVARDVSSHSVIKDNTARFHFIETPVSVTHRARPWAVVSVATWVATPLFAWLVLTRNQLPPVGPEHFRVYILVGGAAAAIWFGLTTTWSLVANLAVLEFMSIGPFEYVLFGLCGLSTAIWAFWVIAVDVWVDGTPASLLSIGASIIIFILGAIAISACLANAVWKSTSKTSAQPPYVGLHHPASHVSNDHLMVGFLFSFTVASTFVAYRLLSSSLGTWMGILLAIVPFVTAFGDNMFFTSDMYSDHITCETTRGAASKSVKARVLGHDSSLARELNNERIRRIKRKANLTFFFAKFCSPAVLVRVIGTWFANRVKAWVSSDIPNTMLATASLRDGAAGIR